MSNFWGQALGAVTQAPPAAVPARPVVGGYQPSPYFTPSQPVQPPSQAPEAPEGPEVPGQWGTVAGSLQKAQSAKLTDVCPDCGSGNYFRPKGMPNSYIQCYDCGYNERFAHPSAGGGITGKANGPVREARQLAEVKGATFHGQVYDQAQGGAGRV